MRELLSIDPKKATTGNSFPSKILTISTEISADVLQNLFNDMLAKGNFQDKMKIADITPVFKKKYPLKQRKLKACKFSICYFKSKS